MEIHEFIENFADLFDDTDRDLFSEDTVYRDLDEWSSLTALAVINMIEKRYNIIIKNEDMRTTKTIKELFNLLQSKH